MKMPNLKMDLVCDLQFNELKTWKRSLWRMQVSGRGCILDVEAKDCYSSTGYKGTYVDYV